MAAIPNVSAEQLLQAMRDFDLSFRDLREWQNWTENESFKYAIFNDAKLYPVKAIVSMATGASVKNFSGGTQANGYVGKRGLQLVNLRAHSWTIESGMDAYKVLDKSSFLHRGTVIPIEVRPFFINGQMGPGESRPVTLLSNGKDCNAHIEMSNHSTPRTRLFWNTAFANILKQSFPHHNDLYQHNQQPRSEIILRLRRLHGFDSYHVSFSGEVSEEATANDVEADDVENGIAAKEGAVVTYYGKRYERSPINRKKAIKVHGLSCNVCGFNFERIYGARGADFIEVHHVKPIHTYEEEQLVDPKADLITVCSNCHRMIHRDPKNIITVEDLKGFLNSQEPIS